MRSGTDCRRSGWALVAIGLGLTACAAPEPGPLRPPHPVGSAVDQYGGTLLVGSVHDEAAAEVDADPADALVLRMRLVYVEDLPPTALAPLASRTRLVASIQDPTPILPTPLVVRDAHAGAGPEAARLREALEEGLFGRTTVLAERVLALPRQSTALLQLSSVQDAPVAEAAPDPSAPAARPEPAPESQLFVHVSRASEAIAVSFGGRQLGPEERAAGGPAGSPGLAADAAPTRYLQHELALLADRPEPDGAPLVVVSRVRTPGEGRALVFLVELSSAPDPAADPAAAEAHAQATAQALERIRDNALAARERARPGSVEAARRQGLARVLADLGEPEPARSTLISLASGAGARVALDLALAAPEDALVAYAQTLGEELAPEIEAGDTESLAWSLDRHALELLARDQMLGEARPELDALLLVHTGQVGRYPGSVIEHVARAKDRADFEARVLRENQELLLVPHAAERVRAYDWLRQRDAAPPGYDPMAPEAQRRAAVQALRAELDSPAEESR